MSPGLGGPCPSKIKSVNALACLFSSSHHTLWYFPTTPNTFKSQTKILQYKQVQSSPSHLLAPLDYTQASGTSVLLANDPSKMLLLSENVAILIGSVAVGFAAAAAPTAPVTLSSRLD